MGKIRYDITANNADFIAKMDQVKGEIRKTSGLAKATGNDFGALGRAATAAFSTAALAGFAKEVVNVRGEIQALEQSFNVLAGAKGGALFEEIRRFAVETPMGMQELAKGAQTLLGFNIEAERVMPILRQIGDISMGDAQKFNSLTLAFAQMSSTGKLMGQDLLQMINAGFNPLSVIAEQTGKSVAQLKEEMSAGVISAEMVAGAFAAATSEGGKFNGMLEIQSKGIKGMVSNFEGAVEDVVNTIGEQTEGIITGVIGTATNLVQNYEKVGKAILDIAIAYGAYKAAVIALSVVENARYQAALVQMAGMTKMQVVMDVLRKKTEALNVAMAKNPYVLAGIAIAGLIFGIYKLITAKSAEERAIERANKKMDEWNEKMDQAKSKASELTTTLKSENNTILQKEQAWEQLIATWPEIDRMYSRQQWLALSTAEQERVLAETIEKRTEAQLKANVESAKAKYWAASDNYSTATAPEDKARYSTMLRSADTEYKLAQKALNDFLEQKRKAEWEAMPTELKIVSLDENIADLDANIAQIDALIAEEKARIAQTFGGFVTTSPNLTNLQLQRDAMERQRKSKTSERNTLAAQSKEDIQTLGEVTRELLAAQAAVDKAQAEYAKSGTQSSLKALENAKKRVSELSGTFENMSGITWENYRKQYQQNAEKEAEEQKRIEEKKKEYAVKAAQELADARVAAMVDGRQKELAQLRNSYNEELAELQEEWQGLISLYGSEEAIPQNLRNMFTEKAGYKYTAFRIGEDAINKRYDKQEADAAETAAQERDRFLQQYESYTMALDRIDKKYAEIRKKIADEGKAAGLTEEQINEMLGVASQQQAQEVAGVFDVDSSKIVEKWQEIEDVLRSTTSVFDELAQSSSGAFGDLMQLGGDVANAFAAASNGVKMLKDTTQALSIAEKASVILTILSAIVAVYNAIANYYEKQANRKADNLADEFRAYNEHFTEVIKNASNATDAINAYNEAVAENARIEREARVQLRKNGAGYLAGMSGEELEAWKRENMAQYNALADYIKTNIQTIIDAGGSTNDLRNQIQESFTDISFDELSSNLRNALVEGATSATQQVEDVMRNAIAKATESAFSEELAAWYDDFYSAMVDGSLSPEEAARLKESYKAIAEGAKAQNDAALEAAGLLEKQRSAKATAVTQASQDSIDYMNGQLTLGNHTLLGIDSKLMDANTSLTKLLSGTFSAVAHLGNIVRNTNGLPAMAEQVAMMRASLDHINTHGVKLKA